MNMRFSTLPLWRAMIALGVLSLVLLTGVVGMRDVQATLDVPQILVYQGRLTDEDRITVADGAYSMIFTIYSDLSGGSCLWTAADTCGTPTAVSVTVTDGIFTYNLGSGANPFGDELFEDDASVYLGVTIGSDSEMTPRRQIGSAAYAMHAGDSDLLDDLNTSSTGCISACVPVTSSAGNLVVTGDPQSTAISGGIVYINPASADADEVLFGVAFNGAARFSVDEDGDADIANQAAIGASASVSTLNTLTIAQNFGAGATNNLIDLTSTLNAAGNAGTILRGANINLVVGTGAGNDIETMIGYRALLDHDGAGVTDTIIGAQLSIVGSAGTVTNANGITSAVSTDNAAAAITTARGINGSVTQTLGTVGTGYGGDFSTAGTMTTSYGVYASADATSTTNYGLYGKATNGTTDYAIYTADGRVQIEGDATATTPTVATADGELFVAGDIESDGDVVAGSQLAVGTTSGANDLVTTLDTLALGVAGSYYGLNSTVSMSGDGNGAADANVYGSNTQVTLTNSVATDEAKTIYGGRWAISHEGDGTSGRAVGVQSYINGSVGTLSSAIGMDVGIEATLPGTITEAIGLMVDSNVGTDTAIYVARGYVHIDTAVYGSKTAPTFGAVASGTDGTLFVKNDVEIYDGALCVGDSGDCVGSASVDGTIYATNVTVQPNDLAEMFPSLQFLTAGEIVSVSQDNNEYVGRTAAGDTIIGAVSTKPGFTLGRETTQDHHYPVALTGRTPVKVSGENGAIAIGDRVAVSSIAGVGMKATAAGEVVGIAMEAFEGGDTGAVMTFIQPHYWDGVAVVESVTQQEPEPVVQSDRVLVMENGFIKNIMGLSSGGWSVDFDGAFVTEGQYGVLIRGNTGTDVMAYGTLSTQQLVVLTGTTKMEGKMAEVKFEDVDPFFNDVIAPDAPIVVTATMSNGSGTVSIRRKDTNGFELWRESGTGDEVDWIAMAYRVGKAPEEDEEKEEEEVIEDVVDAEPIDETDDAPPSAVETTDTSTASGEEAADEPVVEEPVDEEPVVEEPVDDAEDTVDVEQIDNIDDPSDEPVIKEPVAEEAVADTPDASDPTDEPVPDEPVTPNEIP